jgi:hypothetical protein
LAATPLICKSGHDDRAAEADRTAARYLRQRLGAEAGDYVRRVAGRLADAGEIEKAQAWTAIGEALAEPSPQPTPGSGGEGGSGGADRNAAAAARQHRKAAQCRRLAEAIDRLNDPTRSALLRVAEELEREADAEAATEPDAAETTGDPCRVRR